MTGCVRKIADLERAGEAAQRCPDRIGALHEINLALSSTLELRQVLNLLLEKLDLVLPFPVATTVRLWNPETQRLESLACRNLDEQEWRKRQVTSQGGRAYRVMQSGAPVVVPDVRLDPDTHDSSFFAKHGLVSYLGLPLTVRGRTIGVLGVYTREKHSFTADELEFLTTLAAQAAVAIHNARLYEEAEAAKKKAESANRYLDTALSRLARLYAAMTPLSAGESTKELAGAIIDRLIEATGADAAAIRLWDPDSGIFRILEQRGFSPDFLRLVGDAPAGGSIDWVITHGEPIIAPDIASDPRFKSGAQLKLGLRSCAILPFAVRGRVRGVIHVSSRKPNYFDADQREHLLAIARQMAIVVENLDLLHDLRRSRDELEKADRIKDEFLSVISHELRTPLNVILGYLQLLEGRALGPLTPEQCEALRKIDRQSRDLLRMIETILDATAADVRRPSAGGQAIEPSDLLATLRADCEALLDNDRVALEWDCDVALPVLRSDPRKIRQILLNLVDNALKFTPQGKVRISIRAREELPANSPESSAPDRAGRWLELEVADTGIGIQPDALPRIFDRFYQADTSITREHRGMGLGLYVVKQLTELLHGTITVQSQPGKGSTFTVRIPLSPVESRQNLSQRDTSAAADNDTAAGHPADARKRDAGAAESGLTSSGRRPASALRDTVK
ncbi:MAG TPA: GAF domain-containing protein [candidate division Zixibacteria bacterium]|nr:GAF domain-containing protein [candidate division Zixibacteria bacterium]